MSSRDVVLTRQLSAAPEAVFDAWVTPSIMRRWMFVSDSGEIVRVDAEAVPGGRYSVLEVRAEGEVDHFGVYEIVDRPTRLSFSLEVPAHFDERTVVTVSIEPTTGGSLIRFRQGGIDRDVTQTFWETMLDDLADVLRDVDEGRTPRRSSEESR